MGRGYVLDAWALLAFIQAEEPAASRVRGLLEAGKQPRTEAITLSVINLGEIYYSIGRRHGELPARSIVAAIRQLPLAILPATDERVLAAASLKSRHRLAYADAFAAAASDELGATLLTGDPELLNLAGILDIEPLNRSSPAGG
ncbi:MAG: type II toxin-antitoxin system VapC family toxin [Candidatus Promineifilaceae bacterium]